MNVYCVLSEQWHDVSYDRLEEEWCSIAVIVAAKTRGQARYLAIQSERAFKAYGPLDWPRLWCKRIGQGLFNPGVLKDDKWWDRVGDWQPGIGRGRR